MELKLLLLGPASLERDGAPVALETRKALALLAYLAASGQAHSRETLAALLWPDYAPARAFANLRRTLWALTRAGLVDLVEAEGESLALNPAAGLWTDLGEFRRLLAEGRSHGHAEGEPCARCVPCLNAAAALYRGDFMTGFSLRDAAPFDEWQLAQAEGLRRDLAGALERLARALADQGEHEPAIAAARRWLSLDPLNEAAHRRLMQLYAAAGQRSAALRQYQEAARIVQAELGAPPQPETTALYEQIQASGQAAPAAAPAGPRHNLPAQLSSFVGREKEIAEVRRRLTPGAAPHPASADPSASAEGPGAAVRLLTLTGPGGSGKTRLALRVAADLAGAYAAGAWWVELTMLSEPARVLPRVAAIFGVPEAGARSLDERLVDYLRERHLLLLLDNCEHLIEACAALAERLLSGAPHLTILATSREPLGLTGESIYRVPSLTLPAADDPTLAALERSESGRLFAERAAAVQPGFALTAANAPAVAQICQRLDGIPLALELAAARVRAMPPEQIAARLDDRFRLLTGGSRTALPRQQTLRALIDWSWDLLLEPERALLRRTAVFAGGWSLEAAESIAALPASLPPADILDTLARLVDKSLVLMEAQAGVARYHLLETVRQYARDRLVESGETEPVRDQHLAYYTAYAEAAEAGLRGAEQAAWLERLEAEHGNLQTALDWCLGRGAGAAQLGLRLAGALGQFWAVRGYWTEGREYAARLLARPENAAPTLARAKALNGVAFLDYSLGRLPLAEQEYQEALALWRPAGPSRPLADALRNYGNVTGLMHEPAAGRALLEESLAISRGLGDREGEAWTLFDLGQLALHRADAATAESCFRQSLALHRQLNNPQGMAILLADLGIHEAQRGQFEASQAMNEESLSLSRSLGDRRGIAAALGNLGWVAAWRGDLAAAEVLLEEGLPLWRDIGVNATGSLLNLGLVRLMGGKLEAAEEVIGPGARAARETGDPWVLGFALYCQSQLHYYRGQLDEAAALLEECVRAASGLGDHWSLPDALEAQGWVAYRLGDRPRAAALLREALARYQAMGRLLDTIGCVERLAALEPRPARAAWLLSAAAAARQALGVPVWPVALDEYAGLLAEVKARLPAAEFEGAWAKGQALGGGTIGAEDWERVAASLLGD